VKATQGWAEKGTFVESLCSVKASGVGPKGEVFNRGLKSPRSQQGLGSEREISQRVRSLWLVSVI